MQEIGRFRPNGAGQARSAGRRSCLIALLAAVLGLLAIASPAQGAGGALDPSFGGDGKVVTDFGAMTAYAIAIQADGKIVAVGDSGYRRDFALARYNVDGSLDASFGGDGKC